MNNLNVFIKIKYNDEAINVFRLFSGAFWEKQKSAWSFKREDRSQLIEQLKDLNYVIIDSVKSKNNEIFQQPIKKENNLKRIFTGSDISNDFPRSKQVYQDLDLMNVSQFE